MCVGNTYSTLFLSLDQESYRTLPKGACGNCMIETAWYCYPTHAFRQEVLYEKVVVPTVMYAQK